MLELVVDSVVDIVVVGDIEDVESCVLAIDVESDVAHVELEKTLVIMVDTLVELDDDVGNGRLLVVVEGEDKEEVVEDEDELVE